MSTIATHTPFRRDVVGADAQDWSYFVAEVVVDSGPLIEALDALGHDVVDPNAPFYGPLIEAAREVRVLADMRSSWTRHCDERSVAPADPAGDSLRYIDGKALRTWSRVGEAAEAAERAEHALRRLFPALVDFYGSDVTAGKGAA